MWQTILANVCIYDQRLLSVIFIKRTPVYGGPVLVRLLPDHYTSHSSTSFGSASFVLFLCFDELESLQQQHASFVAWLSLLAARYFVILTSSCCTNYCKDTIETWTIFFENNSLFFMIHKTNHKAMESNVTPQYCLKTIWDDTCDWKHENL